MQIEATSDFDLDESDSASEVFAIDEEDVDQNAATAMGPAQLDEEDRASSTPTRATAGSPRAAGTSTASRSRRWPRWRPRAARCLRPRGDSAEWGGLWVGLLGVGTILTLLAAFVSIDLMRNLYDFHGDGPASGIINALAGLFPK